MNNAIKVVNVIEVVNANEPEYVTNINRNPRGEYDSVSIQCRTPFCLTRKHMNTILANTTTWKVKFKPMSCNATQIPTTNLSQTK